MSGCIPFLRGSSYESQVAKCLSRLTWKSTGELVAIINLPAGASHANDIQFYAPPAAPAAAPPEPDADAEPSGAAEPPAPAAPRVIGLEIKTCGAVEAGQRSFRLTADSDPRKRRLVIPDNTQNQIHRYCIPAGFQPFKGRVPSFLLGDRSFKTWRTEMHHFRSEYITIPEKDIISRYYQRKGSDYIQIQNLGLFHTGSDPCGFGVPLFTCAIRMRVRCKQHGSISVPSSVLAALEIVDRARLAPSPYCLESRPPPALLPASAVSAEPAPAPAIPAPAAAPAAAAENFTTRRSLSPSPEK